ncbi:MAG: SxtJ family membrane protein [Sulfuricurvum sp.]|uniref:SxtJ family membrane protein n=1 Tax=Sulfuricurvum sp. TaxID=2025608 RepID=UPI0027324D04|nr:SxtJ family membrane protein [Sulfuricurvum sp.]MDP2850891.1 SxtJ family membrane protein [Sulfuricurvum sp.]
MNREINELKKFSLLLALISFAAGSYFFISASQKYPLFFIVSISFLIIAYTRPALISLLYSSWMKIGHFMGAISSKIILSILFYVIFTPIAIVLRLRGKDLLNKKLNTTETSYWINRKDQPNSMKNQF